MVRKTNLLLIAVSLTAIPFRSALGCECGPYFSNEEIIQYQIENLHRSAAVIDGIVVKAIDVPDYVGIIRPTKIWFGPKQKEFKIIQPHMCDDDNFFPNTPVRVKLYLVKPEPSPLNRIKAFLGLLEPVYFSSCRHLFELYMQHPAMREGVRREAERRRKEALKKRWTQISR